VKNSSVLDNLKLEKIWFVLRQHIGLSNEAPLDSLNYDEFCQVDLQTSQLSASFNWLNLPSCDAMLHVLSPLLFALSVETCMGVAGRCGMPGDVWTMHGGILLCFRVPAAMPG
jgi:hypothetical protein